MSFLTPFYLKELANTIQTPLYVYDFNAITQQYHALKTAFEGRKSLICYALKANSNLSLIQHLSHLESGADCVSIGEVKRALLAGIPKYKIIFSGVGKQDFEIREALKLDILFLNAESEAELLHIEKIAKELLDLGEISKPARISVRVNPNIDPKTHPYIATGLQENKFGVDIEVAKKMYLLAHKSPVLEPVGIHFHIGSQLTQLEPIAQSAQKVASLVRSLLALKIDIKFFDVGGGIGICYTNEKTITPYDYAQSILSALSGLDITIICEAGRFLVGNCGILLTSVLYEKYNGQKRFVIVDAAMNDLMRPTLYGATHRCIPLNLLEANADVLDANLNTQSFTPCDVVGPICESGDYLAKNVLLPPLKEGELLAFLSAGAYGFSMSSNYNTRPRGAEVALLDNEVRLIRKRETFEDLVANEKECLNAKDMPIARLDQ